MNKVAGFTSISGGQMRGDRSTLAPNTHMPSIGIIGGGFTGAAVAYHLARSHVGATIIVFEPRARLGAGLAYDTTDDALRVNVSAGRMSLLPEDQAHFARWLVETRAFDEDPDALWADGEVYPRRSVFGAYVTSQLAPLLAGARIRHVGQQVTSVARTDGRWQIVTAGGTGATVDFLIIATTHPKPRLPTSLAALARDPRLLADGLEGRSLRAIEPSARVLIVGAGLSAADVVASLDARRHEGPITMISRHGLRSRVQAFRRPAPYGDFSTAPARTAGTLLKAIRRAIRAAAAEGIGWQAVIDALRSQGDAVWNALPLGEQLRLLRHLRAYWDAHRFRLAPQTSAVLERNFAGGRLEFFAASLQTVAARGDAIVVGLRDRRRQKVITRVYDRIVVTTGPAHADILTQQPYLAGLAEAGFIALDPTRLGLHTSRDGRAIGRGNQISASLFIAGPLARGTFGELMGLPQVSDYAAFIAAEIGKAVDLAQTGTETIVIAAAD